MGNSDSREVTKERKKPKHYQQYGSKSHQPPPPQNANHQTQNSQPVKEEVAKDVMISYSRTDIDILKKIQASIEREGITVWNDVDDLDSGADFLSKIGQAVIDCKIFLLIASEKSIQSKFCQDELALSYISNKAIIPVGLKPLDELFSIMDTGMRLQLARFDWYPMDDLARFTENMVPIVKRIKEVMGNTDEHVVNTWFGAHGEDEGQGKEMRKALNRQQSRPFIRTMSGGDGEGNEEIDVMNENYMNTFWERHFNEETEVPWFGFVSAFTKEYEKQINQVFRENKDKVWLISILHRELEVAANKLSRNKYNAFCFTINGRQPFWVRVQDQAVESYTIREVFNMESSVRVEAIENLGKFKSPAVVEALIDLLSDNDNNVKAVAAISLARTETNTSRSREKLMMCLEDKDRLVRESGCLALGHLKVEEAVPKLIQLWRNDFISSVREAASLSLEQIGGEEANKAIHMTKVLSEEIKQLTAPH